jgi:hypothetical protein
VVEAKGATFRPGSGRRVELCSAQLPGEPAEVYIKRSKKEKSKMSIMIRFGVSNQVTRDVAAFPTTNSILRDPSLRQGLGFGENVEAVVNGSADIHNLTDGDIVDIRSKSNTKGN